MLFFLPEYPSLAIVFHDKLRFYFLQETLSGLHRLIQWLLYSLYNTSVSLCPNHGVVTCLPLLCCGFLKRAGTYIFHFCLFSAQSPIWPLMSSHKVVIASWHFS